MLYSRKQAALVDEKARIEGKLALSGSNVSSVQRVLAGLEIMSGLEKSYQQADDYGKADLLRCVGEKFVLTANNEIAVEYKEPFKGIYEAKMNNRGGSENLPQSKKTALLNQGCLDSCIDKTATKSCRKNDWGQPNLELMHIIAEENEIWKLCLDDLDRHHTPAPTLIGLNYEEFKNNFEKCV